MPDSSPHIVLVELAGETVSVAVTFKNRERLSISVHPDGSVTALAPAGRPLADVQAHLKRRQSWIARQRRHFQKYLPLPLEKRYVSGETHLYLGRQYRLRVHQADDTSVRLVGAYFEVCVPTPKRPQTIAAALRAWYQSHAESLFAERMRRCGGRICDLLPGSRGPSKSGIPARQVRQECPTYMEPHFRVQQIADAPRCVQTSTSLQQLGEAVKLQVRPMERRWGSCSKAGMITLNTNLVKTPLHCIDYVITHELCHLRVHDHSPAFFRMLGRCMPDWQRCKDRLESMVMR